MGWYEPDFYDEPSEFDVMMHEFRQSLMVNVKKEYIEEMNQLRKENAELQDIKSNFNDIKSEYSRKKNELEREYQDLKGKVRRERLSSLMKDLEVELYTVSYKRQQPPKCNKCDQHRRIKYITPLGRTAYESCVCDKTLTVYLPQPILLTSLSIRNGEGSAWYKVRTDNYDEWLEYYDDSISGNDVIKTEEELKDLKKSYGVMFKTLELAQKYCDIKNSEEVKEFSTDELYPAEEEVE